MTVRVYSRSIGTIPFMETTMSKFISVVLCLLLLPIMLPAQTARWQRVPGLDTARYKSVFAFGDTLHVHNYWAGKLLSSTNSGASWSAIQLRPATEAMFFLTSNMGWCIAEERHVMLHTVDGGMTWDSTTKGLFTVVNSVGTQQFGFTSPMNGFFVAFNGSLNFTTNGGATWTWKYATDRLTWCVTSPSSYLYYVGLTNGILNVSIDRTAHWRTSLSDFWSYRKPIEAIRSAPFDTNYCWAIGNLSFSFALKTYDQGNTWKPVVVGPDSTRRFTRISLFSHDHVWIAGNSGVNGVVFHTENGNDTTGNVLWRKDTLENSPLYDLAMQSSDSGWAVGRYVWHYTPWQITSVEEAPVETVIRLEQNYPNPVFPDTRGRHETTIAYTLPERTSVTLKIYTLMGREVATLVNEELSPGRHAMTWDASRHAHGAPGVLLYVLTTPRARIVRKMMVAR